MILSDARFRPWLEARLGMSLASDAQFIGRIVANEVVAAVSLSHWTGHDAELSVAGTAGSGTRELISTVFAYAFDQLGCRRITVKTRASNSQAIRLAERLGFRWEGTLRAGFGDEAAHVFGLLKEESNGKWRRQTTSGPGSGNDHPVAVPVQPVQLQQPIWVVVVEH